MQLIWAGHAKPGEKAQGEHLWPVVISTGLCTSIGSSTHGSRFGRQRAASTSRPAALSSL